MTYDNVKQEIIDHIHSDPAGFFLSQYEEGGAFANTLRSFYELQEVPAIMQVKDTGDIRLEIMFWDIDYEAYASYVDRAHAAVADNGLEWQERTLARRPHTRLIMIEDEVDAIALGHATYEWEDILSNINICRTARVYAWFFPLGAKAARERLGLTMYANNRPTR